MNRVAQVIFMTAILLTAEHARATIVTAYGRDGRGTGLQTKLNPLVTAGVGDTWNPGVSNGGSPADYVNGTIQNGQSLFDTIWSLAGAGSSATIVLEIAGNSGANTFGFYDLANSANKTQLFTGGASTASRLYVKFNGTQLQRSLDNITFNNVGSAFSSTTFGMYLQGPGGTFYSNPSLNSGGGDNMVAYQGYNGRTLTIGSLGPQAWDANSYVVGWEDLAVSDSDRDYQDMVLLVSQIAPVPEPTTILAGALLLLPFAASTLRRFRK